MPLFIYSSFQYQISGFSLHVSAVECCRRISVKKCQILPPSASQKSRRMAETVKKSRIVSENEDNLEEALMEEFNMRLKKCMSQDDLKNSDDEHENSIYENYEIRNSNDPKSIKTASQDFIESEKGNYYEEPVRLIKNGTDATNGDSEKQNGHLETENIYENVPSKISDPPPTNRGEYVDMKKPEVDSYETMETEYEPVEPKNDYEVFEAPGAKKRPSFNLHTPSCEEVEAPTKSAKDRMLLATDDVACLLFTQTVTSPMLTPSEENIDFLKGFRRESTQNADSATSNGSPKSSDLDGEVYEGRIQTEVLYENTEIVRESAHSTRIIHESSKIIEENVYVNVGGEEFPIYENIDDLGKEATATEVDDLLGEPKPPENVPDDPKKDFEVIEPAVRSVLKNTVLKTPRTQARGDQISKRDDQDHQSPEIGKTVEISATAGVPSEVPQNVAANEEVVQVLPNSAEVSPKFADVAEVLAKSSERSPQSPERSPKSPERSPNSPERLPKSPECSNSPERSPKSPERSPKSPERSPKFDIPSKATEASTRSNRTSQREDASSKDEQILRISTHRTKIVDELVKTITTKESDNRMKDKEKDTETVPPAIVKNLTSQFLKGDVKSVKREMEAASDLRTVDIMKQINKFEQSEEQSEDESTEITTETTSYVETTTFNSGEDKSLKKKKSKKSRKEHEKENISVKSSFNKFDALQKKNVLHVRSSDSSKAQEKFNGAQLTDNSSNCKCCSKPVFQMEQIKAEKAIWHKNCFRCHECNKQLTVDTYESHEATLYCKPHFKALFAPKVVEDEEPPSDKPDLGLEELQSLNVKERFQVFEHFQSEQNSKNEELQSAINVKRSPSILSKLARFQAKGMDIGVSDEALNGIPIEESSSEAEEEEVEAEGEDSDLVRARRVQKEKPFHFTGMSDVKNKWEHGEQNSKDERREERKQEIQSIRNRLFMGKQGKMKEAYQQAVMESESCANMKKLEQIEACDTKSIKERFEKGDVVQTNNKPKEKEEEENEVFESEISKQSRSLFLQLDAIASKPPQISPVTPPKVDIKKARESYLAKSASQDTVKSSELVDDVVVQTADIQQRFKFFETYKEPEKTRKEFRITPPREGQVKSPTPDREVYKDPDVVRSEEVIEDSVIAKETHTATKMLNKFRQMEENLSKEPQPQGPKPLKRFTPPPEPAKEEPSSEEGSGSEEESDDEVDNSKVPDDDLLEAQKAARAKQLRAKFEKWEANEIKREQNNSSINIIEEFGEDQSQIESTKSLRARFESMRESNNEINRAPRVKVNRFVELSNVLEICESCNKRVYPLEKISVHGHIYHKGCFKCMECSTILRMDSYSYNQGLLYCMPHFKRLFISKGNYDSAFGLDGRKEKLNATMA